MPPAVKLCRTPEDYEAWDDFVLRYRGAHYSQLYGWLSSYEAMGFDCDVMVGTRSGCVVAGAAFVSIKVPLLSSRVFILPHAPLCDEMDDASWFTVMDALDQEFRRQRAIYAQTWPHVVRTDLAALEKYVAAGYVGPELFRAHSFSSTFLGIRLHGRNEEEILGGFRQETRYHLRKSEKMGFALRFGRTKEDLKRSYDLLRANAQYHGFEPRPYSSLEMAFERLLSKDRACLIQAWKDDALAGTMLLLLAGRTATYYCGAIDRRFGRLYPSEFMHLQALRYAKGRGLEAYDLMNWVHPGVEQFKRGFRPEERQWAEPRTKIFRPHVAAWLTRVEAYARPLVRRFARWRAVRRNRRIAVADT
jgi:lipid II:glycine glycyltransferase (peptidoglycan interpeptide bridge formation enzyme)